MAVRSQKNAGKLWAPKSESDDEMSVQVICAPQKKTEKKTTINTLDVSVEKMDYQKKLKWLKDHGELTAEESCGNDSA
jgi:phosphoserine aminotransferase